LTDLGDLGSVVVPLGESITREHVYSFSCSTAYEYLITEHQPRLKQNVLVWRWLG